MEGVEAAEAAVQAKMPAKSRARWLGVLLPSLLILLFFVVPSWSLLGKANLFGYAICHQLPERSFHLGGAQLPLCARCSGTFLAALLGLGALGLAGRSRFAGMPPARVLAAIPLFLLVWGVDGLNSFASFFPHAPQLYAPSNLLRLITGALAGVAVSLLLHLVLSMLLWRQPDRRPFISGLKELALLLLLTAGMIVIVYAEWPFMLYPLALLEALGVWVMLTGINVALFVLILQRENTLERASEALPYLLWGAACALMEVGVIALARAWLTQLLPTVLTILFQVRA